MPTTENPKIKQIQVSGTLYDIEPANTEELVFDDTPTANSDNPVKSGGIKSYVDEKLEVGEVDVTFNGTETSSVADLNNIVVGDTTYKVNIPTGALKFIGTTTTELYDGCTTNPITVNGQSVTASSGDVAIYGHKEFLWNGSIATPAWAEVGDGSSYALKTVTVTGTGALSGGGSLAANRTITHNTSGVSAGTYQKVTVDTYGHVTSGTTLDASDIPNISASKITSGTIGDARIASAETWNAKQNALPTTTTAGKVLKSTSTAGTVEWGDAAATGVTSVTAGTGLTGGTITSTGTIAVDTDTIATKTYVDGKLELGDVDLTLTSTSITDGTTTLDISIPTIVISLDTAQTEYNQIIIGPGSHGSSTYFTLTTTPSQQTILENENNGIIKIDLTGLGRYAPVPYIWIKRNVGRTLQGLNLIQFTFDNAGFIYDNALSKGYVYMHKIGNGGVIYEATHSKYLFITYENFNPDSIIASIPTNLKNSSGSASLIQRQFSTFTTSNSQAIFAGYTSNVSVRAAGAASIVLGGISRAEGDSSLVCGKNNIVTGWAAACLGQNCYASGSASFATGDRATASGTASTALGQGVVAEGGTQTVVGRWNDRTNSANYAFIVGNGSSDTTRSNALTIDWNGCAVVSGGLKVHGNKDVLTLDTLPIWNGDVE